MAYIEREAAYELARTNDYYSDFYRSMADLTSLKELLEDTPAADVVEVVHGEWISEFGSYCTPRCSACGWHKPYTEDYYCAQELYSPWNYCPNCGADMRGEKNDALY